MKKVNRGNLPATILLFVMWFGYGIWSKVLVTVLIAFFPITITVYDGLQSARIEMTELLLTEKSRALMRRVLG